MITIHASPAYGLIVVGTEPHHAHLFGRRRGGLGLRWSDHITYNDATGAWYLPRSRDQHPSKHQTRIAEIEQRLRAEGLAFHTELDTGTRAPHQAEAELNQRAQARAAAYRTRAIGAHHRAETHHDKAAKAIAGYPPDQPILAGHHSQRAHENAYERSDRHTRKAFAESDKARYWVARHRAAEHLERHRNHPNTTVRRIERLQAQLARVTRQLDGTAHPQLATDHDGQAVMVDGRPLLRPQPATGSYRDQLLTDQQILTGKIAYWKEIVTRAEADGVKIWRQADFAAGDYALFLGTWFEVTRANTKTVTIAWGHLEPGQQVMSRANARDQDGQPSTRTERLPYHQLQGRRSASDMAELLNAEPPS